jgi:F-type H+-transporting ATPase subunit b
MIPQINFSLLITQGIIFLLVLLLLNKTLFKPILKILHEREERTEGFFKKSEEIGERAKETLEKYKEKIRLARRESLNIKRKYISEGNEEKEDILKKAREETNKYLESIRNKIAEESDATRKVLIKQVENLSRGIAEKVLGRSLRV